MIKVIIGKIKKIKIRHEVIGMDHCDMDGLYNDNIMVCI